MEVLRRNINKEDNKFKATVDKEPISIAFIKDFVNDMYNGKINKNNYVEEYKENIFNNKTVLSKSSGKSI